MCIRGGGGTRRSRGTDIQPELKENQQAMADGQGGSETNAIEQNKDQAEGSAGRNIILNHDFSKGLQFWHPNSCRANIVSDAGGHYVVVTDRKECWQGLEQDISSSVAQGLTYSWSALVRVGGDVPGTADVQATLRLDYEDAPTEYQFLARVTASKDGWLKLAGSFSLSRMPKCVTFYLEGPPSGVDLHIRSVAVCLPPASNREVVRVSSDRNENILQKSNFEDGLNSWSGREARVSSDGNENIVQNSNFEDGLNNWSARGCKIIAIQDSIDGKVFPLTGKVFASATNRSQSWNGIQQEITSRVQRKTAYEVTAVVRLHGTSAATVRATLWVQNPNGREQYIGISNLQISDTEWSQLQGKFLLNGSPSKVVIYLEGPPPGTDILINSMVVKHAEKVPPLPPPDFEGLRSVISSQHNDANIIANNDFSRGLDSWNPNNCRAHVISEQQGFDDGISAKLGVTYALISGRTECWQGLEQDITAKVSPGSLYSVSAWVRVGRFHEGSIEIKGTLKLEHDDSPTSYLSTGRVSVTSSQWTELKGSFSLTVMPKCLIFFLEGPPPGVDLLVHSVTISLSGTSRHQNPLFGKNIIKNSDPRKSLGAWYPLGSCTLNVCTGGPQLLPPAARDSLGQQVPVHGNYILATNRTETWMGPAQNITGMLKWHLTYQVSAWVRVGPGANGSQTVNVALGVDGNWVNGGQTEVQSDRWYELAGSFRIEKHPSKVVAYVQGPVPGVDLMVSDLLIFPVKRKDRFIHLKEQTEKVRKREVLLKFTGQHANESLGAAVTVNQIANSFPFGSCINRSNLDNEEFVEFFVKNFNWAVFGNELKWYHTEPEQGKLSYSDADEMLNFCKKHGIKTRGHCIFWEVLDAVQPWVQSLSITNLMTAVQNRLRGLLLRYKGQFEHYDVNNEMLHGTFYQERLGRDIRSYMFKAAHELDPSAKLFVNDYNVEDGRDAKSCPERYIQQILDLQECGAPVHGIGIQGHIRHPVGPIICSALDKLAILGLPIWFTELDVSASNEHVRADDLEVVLREAFAHPAVEGIMLWGFWEMFMCDDHCHLVSAEGDINEAGKRFLELKREWMTNTNGEINDNGEFTFRGFHGTYNVEVKTPTKVYSKTLVVEKGGPCQLVEIEL